MDLTEVAQATFHTYLTAVKNFQHREDFSDVLFQHGATFDTTKIFFYADSKLH